MAAAVWPEVLAAAPEARLTLLGPGDPPAALTRLPRVDVAGRVDDLAAALGRARVVVVPIRRGMGARVKFVEALASGAAVVSTAEGAEGFEADGAFVEADDPGEFARACSKLVREDTHARALGAKGRERALSRYTWKQVSQPLLAFARGC
jgi:glycosyltransferase involved in cell wall biosynthesis